ncbi:IPT/TIG domain-containing protein [Saccharopolyspora halophila]|uniref:IPT/TIG domain-containing protein n=1 Tax=Saccharopolyspora halophila TaxID=405551 RepID=UPI0031DDFB1E
MTSISPTSGPTAGGTTVTVNGSAFLGASSVTFGGTSAPFSVNSNARITATAPPRPAGPARVVVVTPGGTSTNPVFFNYQAPPTPTVTGVSPANAQTSGGTVVTITGSDLSGATAVTFGGTPAVSYTVSSNTQITATAPPRAAGPAPVVVTTPGGTSNETVVVFFVSAPVLLNLSPTRGPVAGGTVVTITGSDLSGATAVTFGGTPAVSYTVTSNTQITATAPPRAAGPAPVVVTTPGGTSNAVSFAYIAVPVITAVTPDQGPATGGNNVTITGSNLTFTSTVTFDGTPAAFTVLSDALIAATVPPGTRAAQVSVTSPGGTSAQLTYTYVDAPQI